MKSVYSSYPCRCNIHHSTEGRIVEEEDVEVRPEKVPTACIDENVHVSGELQKVLYSRCLASHNGCCHSY